MDTPLFFMENDQFYTRVFQSSPLPMSITDPATGRYVDVNKAFLKALGYQRDEVIAKTALELGVFYDPQQRAHLLEKMKLQGSLRDEEVLVQAKSGDRHSWVLSAEFIDGQDRLLLLSVMSEIPGHPAMQRDIPESQQIEAALQEAEARWQFALEGAGDGVWDWNAQTNRVFYSNRWKSMLGYAPHEIGDTLDEWKQRVHPDDLEGVLGEIEKHFSGQAPQYSSEHRVLCKDGQYKWILDRGQVIQWTADRRPLRVIGTHTDITQRRQADEAVKHLLREKELLLGEVHHRIKNNMSTMVSLLRLQAGSLSDPAAVQALEEASQRVIGMLAIYDLLYRGSDFQRVNLNTYLDKLLDGNARAFSIPGVQVNLVKDVEPVSAPVSLSFMLGILINELVTNAYKYAFSGRSGGTLRVSVWRTGTDLEVSVADDGIGLPEGVDPGAAESFGLGLVNIIAQQLHAELRVERAGGTKFTLLMPLADPG